MLARVHSYGIQGLDAYPLTIEVDVAKALPATVIVGLPDSAVKESKERVRSAIKNSGYKYKPRRVTVNLSPADTKKEGPSFDLAIALGILAASEQVRADTLRDFIILGELSLDGRIQPVRGTLPIAMAMIKGPIRKLILPFDNAPEAAICRKIDIYPARSLAEVIYLLSDPDRTAQNQSKIDGPSPVPQRYDVDFSDVKGQSHVKRGLEIAAAGNHNVLMVGPPGSGKSMLAKRLPTILPDMTFEESLETTKIHSVMGYLDNHAGLLKTRPFRSPHHTTSDVAIVGGGSAPKPGEVTLSHNGILFLDELPEFNRNVLESLRQPLEDHYVTIARASRTIRFPSQFMLVCAMNPCPCGWYTDPKKECYCNPNQIQRYMSKISGPLLDRIDLHLDVPALPSPQLIDQPKTENSQSIKERATQARNVQHQRFKGSGILNNARMSHRQIKQFCPLSGECKSILKSAIEELNLSARAYDKILKLSRTIADLAGKESIASEHICEAIQYRSLDRGWWG